MGRWITRNGAHIYIPDEDEIVEQEKAKDRQIDQNKEQAEDKQLETHFDSENKRVQEMMGKRSGSVEMENGQILEHYTLGEMKRDVLKDAKDNGECYEDNFIAIQYTDGDIVSYAEGDDTSKMKLTNINGVIWDNGVTTSYAGKGVIIVNYRELYKEEYKKKKYEDDWRMQFEHANRR